MDSFASTTTTLKFKKCLHYDPDSKPCLSAHHLVKSLKKQFKKLDELMASSSAHLPLTAINFWEQASSIRVFYDASSDCLYAQPSPVKEIGGGSCV
jgi:hypothetical protein